MPFDSEMKEVLDGTLAETEGMSSRRMFGGMCYLHQGNMSLGIWHDYLIVRLGSEEAAREFVASGEARPFDITGRPMKGWIMVSKSQLATPADYLPWVERALAFTSTLPPK